MARARVTPVKRTELTPREECAHLVKNHKTLAFSATKKVMLCMACEAHFIITEEGKKVRKFTFGEEVRGSGRP